MNSIRLDIGGPKGNAFYILGLVKGLADDKETADWIRKEMQSGDYNNLLETFIEAFPFVELYSYNELNGVDDDLYTVLDDNDNIEL